jgi:hypothetical protein
VANITVVINVGGGRHMIRQSSIESFSDDIIVGKALIKVSRHPFGHLHVDAWNEAFAWLHPASHEHF